jgi:hypothetical protein
VNILAARVWEHFGPCKAWAYNTNLDGEQKKWLCGEAHLFGITQVPYELLDRDGFLIRKGVTLRRQTAGVDQDVGIRCMRIASHHIRPNDSQMRHNRQSSMLRMIP